MWSIYTGGEKKRIRATVQYYGHKQKIVEVLTEETGLIKHLLDRKGCIDKELSFGMK